MTEMPRNTNRLPTTSKINLTILQLFANLGYMNDWIFKNGAATTTWDTFPYAYRAMFNALKTGVERGLKYDDMVKQMVIISPQKDRHGDPRKYSYAEATELAKASELVDSNGLLNARVFKRR